MCGMEKIIACQISYVPVITDRIDEKVEKILSLIENSGLEWNTGLFATEIKGPKTLIFSLIQEIFEGAEEEGQFILEIKLSNICGC